MKKFGEKNISKLVWFLKFLHLVASKLWPRKYSKPFELLQLPDFQFGHEKTLWRELFIRINLLKRSITGTFAVSIWICRDENFETFGQGKNVWSSKLFASQTFKDFLIGDELWIFEFVLTKNFQPTEIFQTSSVSQRFEKSNWNFHSEKYLRTRKLLWIFRLSKLVTTKVFSEKYLNSPQTFESSPKKSSQNLWNFRSLWSFKSSARKVCSEKYSKLPRTFWTFSDFQSSVVRICSEKYSKLPQTFRTFSKFSIVSDESLFGEIFENFHKSFEIGCDEIYPEWKKFRTSTDRDEKFHKFHNFCKLSTAHDETFGREDVWKRDDESKLDLPTLETLFE